MMNRKFCLLLVAFAMLFGISSYAQISAPTEIAGCELWLDASDPSGNGSIPADGDPVATWKDKSGNGKDANQGDSNLQATVAAAALNGKSVLVFSGTQTYSLTSGIANACTVFWVLKETNQGDLHFLLGDATKYDFHRGAASLWDDIYAADPIKSGLTRIDRQDVDGKTTNIPINRDVMVSLITDGPLAVSAVTQDRDLGRNWIGTIAEIIVYSAKLSTDQVDDVETYLYNKWFNSAIVTAEVRGGANDELVPNGSTSPILSNGTDFGTELNGNGTVTHTFTIKSTGADDLELTETPYVSITGDSAFAVVQPASGTIPAGSSVSFSVTFDTSTDGDYTAAISIGNNDLNNNPYTFNVKGSVSSTSAPKMALSGNGNDIKNGALTPSIANGTDFGDVPLNTTVTTVFTISNAGTDTLNLTGSPDIVAISGTDFVITAQPAVSTLAPGESTTFTVSFTPYTTQLFDANLTIDSNDPDNPFRFKIQGTGAAGNTGEGPVSTPGCLLWLDASDPLGDGTVPADGAKDAWIDKAGVGDATQVSSAAQPVFKANSLNGKPVFTFNGSSQYFQFPKLSNIVTLFWVMRESDHNDYHFFIADDTAYDFHRGDNGVIWGDPSSDNVRNGQTRLDQADVNGTSAVFPADGGYHILSLVAAGPTTADSLSSDRTFGRYWHGEIAEVVLYNRALTSTEVTDVENYLNSKWLGTSAPPKIQVRGKNVEIQNGDTTPDVNDNTDYGDSDINSVNPHTFTIFNLGGGVLNISAINITGNDATEFKLETATPIDINSAGNANVQISFAPTSQGLKTATVEILSDDPDISSYTFAIQGSGVVAQKPDIVVSGNSVIIPNGDMLPDVNDNTNFGTIDLDSGTVTIDKTFEIANNGNTPLHVTSVDFIGSNKDYYTVSSNVASPIAPGSSATFTVTFAPASSATTYDVVVSIANDDDYKNPYTFKITGNTSVAPSTESAIQISGNGIIIPNDSSQVPKVDNGTDFGDIEVGNQVSQDFIIENIGLGDDLIIDSVLCSDTAVSIQSTLDTIPQGGTGVFTVTVTASGQAHLIDTIITVKNQSRLDSTYLIKIKANIIEKIEPNVNVLYNGESVPNGGTPVLDNGTDFGQQTINEPLVKEFTIVNIGTSDLTLTDNPPLVISGSAAFSIVEQPSGSVISPGSTAVFKIEFLPTIISVENAKISFANNVPNKSPYEFDITGVGIAGEVSSSINVIGNGIDIKNNDTTPALLDDTDFGTVNAGSKVEHIFTISNNASKDLELTSSDVITISGLDSNQFSVTTMPDTIVKGGGSTTFGVTFTPNVLGDANVTVTIDNNTKDSNPFTFSLHGIGSNGSPISYMRVIGNNEVILNGSTETSVLDNTDYGQVDLNKEKILEFSVENSGNAKLEFNNDPAVEITGNNATSFFVVKPLKSVPAGETVIFSIKFKPTLVGEKTAIVSISSNDKARDPYTFAIRGLANDPTELPVMALLGNGEYITNGSTTPELINGTDFGSASVGMSADQEFVMFNDSFANLLLDSNPIEVSGANAADFVVTAAPASVEIPAKSQLPFTLSFKPTTAGAKTATVTIKTKNAGNFVFAVQGTTLSQPPVANPDQYNVPIDGELVVPNPGVLSNDTAPNNEVLTAEVVTAPTKGTLFLSADGSFSYTPNAGMNGTDTFTYKAKTAATESTPATVTIDIVPAGTGSPIAMNDTYSVSENSILNIPAVGVLGNDIDSTGNALSVSLASYNGAGQLTLNSDGSFSYAPVANFVGNDSFTYTVSNGAAVSNAATVTINVTKTGVNTPPVALGDRYSISINSTLNVSSPGVLSNDNDTNGDSLTAELVSSVSSGHLVFYADGSFAYTPETDFTGTVVFSYKAADGTDYSNVATVSVTVNALGVNNPPVAVSDDYIVPKGQALVIPASGVLDNDFDVDGDPLTAILVGDVSHGTLTLNSDGSFNYLPAGGYVGVDSFSYKANDGQVDSNVVSVIIKIDPNALPGVTEGMLFNVDGASGKIAAMYVEPVKGRQRILRLKSASDGYIWNKAVPLYNKRDYSYSLHKGNPTANWIQANPIVPVPCSIITADNAVLGEIAINPPQITSIERWDGSDFYRGIHTNSVFVIKGKFFGSKVPRVTLEYIDSKKNVKQIRLKIDKNDLLYPNYKGKEGCSPMDPNTGISQVRAYLPGKMIPAIKCWVVLITKTGIGADVGTKGIPSFNIVYTNTPPQAHDDTFVLSGQKSYMLDVLANDFDAESDNVVIMPSGKTSDNGAKLKVLGSRIQYTPKGSGGDTFTYTIDDGHGGQSTATVTIK